MSENRTVVEQAFQAIAIDDAGRTCEDIPESACNAQAGNFFKHVASLGLTKSADGLIDPKLVLSWLMTSLGAPLGLISLLVPVREAGALLPQLATAGYLRRLPQRKWAWAVGSLVQGLAAVAIGFVALTMEGAAAGWAIVGALAVLAIARSVCSVTYKDVLGKTVGKARRGRATGLAGSVAAVVVIAFGLMLSFKLVDRMLLVQVGLFVAGGAWLCAALLFTTLKEESGATEGGSSALRAAIDNLSYLRDRPQLRLFIYARGLLTATALAPPFMIAMGGGSGQMFQQLGFLLLASAFASLLSSYVWGSLADRSSRKVLIFAGAIAAVFLGLTVMLDAQGWLSRQWLLPLLLFGLMVSYQGVRLGRSTYLVDMAGEDERAAFTALSNTIIGLLLLAGGLFSLIADRFGAITVLTIMAGMSAASIIFSFQLDEVEQDAEKSEA